MKKTKKIFGIIMAAMMTATMFLGSFSASAADPPAQSTGTEDDPAQVKIVKTLKYADGITEPDDQFNFTFTKVSVDGVDTDEAKTTMPDLSASVAFSDDTGKYNDEKTAGLNAVSKQSANIFDGKTFPHAGVYVYTVEETGEDAKGYGMDYSEAVYTMRVYVKNGTNGTYVASVTAEKNKDDNGTTIQGGEKVDPTPDEDTTDGIDNKFAFVNVFTKQGGSNGDDNVTPDPIPGESDPEYPEYLEKNASLVINKTVAGEYGDKTMDFNFSITLTKSPTAEDSTYTAKIYTRGTATVVATKTVTPGTPCEFTLKDNQMLIFEDLPAGTTYNVTETAVEKYNTTTELVENGVTKSGGTAIIDKALVGEKDNYARYTNTFDDDSVTPTGIIINNLPFILMIVIAGAGIVLFVISRRRKYNR